MKMLSIIQNYSTMPNSNQLNNLNKFIKLTETFYPLIEDSTLKHLTASIKLQKPLRLNTIVISLDNYINNNQSQLPDYKPTNSKITQCESIPVANRNNKIQAQLYKAATPNPNGNIFLINDKHYLLNKEHHDYLSNFYTTKGFDIIRTTGYIKPEILLSVIASIENKQKQKHKQLLKNTLMVTSISGFIDIIPNIPQSLYSSIILLLTRNHQQLEPYLTPSSYSKLDEFIKSIKCSLYTLNVLPHNITKQIKETNRFINYLHDTCSSETKIKITIHNSYNKTIEELYHNDISSLLKLL